MNKIFCLGLGKLGLIFSYILCDSGYKIYGYDKNPKIKNDIINNANNIEPKLNELIRRNKKNFFYVDEFEQAIKKLQAAFLYYRLHQKEIMNLITRISLKLYTKLAII